MSCHVSWLEREKSDGVIAPIVAQTSLYKLAVVYETVYRHKFDGSYSQAREIFDHGSGGQTRIRPTQLGGNIRLAHRESLYVEFVDDGLVPRDPGWGIRSPGESGVDHAVLRHSGGIVAPVKRQVLLFVSDSVPEVRVAPTDRSLNLLAVRIEQKFVMIKSMPLLGRVWAKHSIPVQLAGTHLGQVAMPDHIRLLGKRNAEDLTFAGNVEQAKFHFLRVLRVESEVDALAVPRGSQRIGPARPDNGLRLRGHLSWVSPALADPVCNTSLSVKITEDLLGGSASAGDRAVDGPIVSSYIGPPLLRRPR